MTFLYRLRAYIAVMMLRYLPRNTPIVYSGAGSSLQLVEQLALLGLNKVLVVTDEFLHNSGLLKEVLEALNAHHIAFEIYDGVLPDPSFDQVQAGEALYRSTDCQGVFAIGGGSVLDAAKLLSILHTNPRTLAQFLPAQRCKNAGVPLFAVPTTAGTGSEITPVAVITDQETHQKTAVVDTRMIPGHIALDAAIMRTMPPGVTAATGMDALTHAVESYLSRGSNEATERQAEAATRLIFKHLPTACKNGDDLVARDAMATAAFYAGSAFSRTSVGYVHAIAHQLGAICGTPHGNANAMVLPEVLTAYGDCVHDRLAQLANRCGFAGEGRTEAAVATEFISAIVDMRAKLELPILPRGLRDEHVTGVVKEAIRETGELYPVPRYFSAQEIERIVRGLLPASQPKTTELN